MKEKIREAGVLYGGSPGVVERLDLGAWCAAPSAVAFLRCRGNFTIDRIPEEHELALGEVLITKGLLSTQPLFHVTVDWSSHRNGFAVLQSDESDHAVLEVDLWPSQTEQRAL